MPTYFIFIGQVLNWVIIVNSQVDARQYPVTVHFNKRTEDDYITEAYRKVI